ncbi:toll/interleukin-1 receptor domain-containing protein [Poritiphilus flavus]|uniref:TIR domain-containing protein n=1 Tax=Poritiphilus flavus TaxID=2697053 RepID=A0A6L9E9J8_9FLAO|nr:toll/interleukin-1 receptor domain-containing protein [Poritiphilus flavus]NAS11323.1 TIR domain-containing protein [Poritiphilus flavus]
MDPAKREKLLSDVLDYLNREENFEWATSGTLVRKIGLQEISPLELDDLLLQSHQENESFPIRFSTLPSYVNLNVLWGSVERIGDKVVESIYRLDEPLDIEDLEVSESPDLFLSHSFRDSELVISLSKHLMQSHIHPWIAETRILRHQHINQGVIRAIAESPAFGVLITGNLLSSVWSAKEIEFAFRNDKKVIGFIQSGDPLLLEQIRVADFSGGNKISQEIFSRFFDNHPDVRFLYFPDTSARSNPGFDSEQLLEWEQLESFLELGPERS